MALLWILQKWTEPIWQGIPNLSEFRRSLLRHAHIMSEHERMSCQIEDISSSLSTRCSLSGGAESIPDPWTPGPS